MADKRMAKKLSGSPKKRYNLSVEQADTGEFVCEMHKSWEDEKGDYKSENKTVVRKDNPIAAMMDEEMKKA